jgi:hypothetical protein
LAEVVPDQPSSAQYWNHEWHHGATQDLSADASKRRIVIAFTRAKAPARRHDRDRDGHNDDDRDDDWLGGEDDERDD